ncbi:hypothetical protein D3C84_858830 [compost metagenome]
MALFFQAGNEAVAIEHAPAEASIGQTFGDVTHVQQTGSALEFITQCRHLQLVWNGDDHPRQVFDTAQSLPRGGQVGRRHFPGHQHAVIPEALQQRVEKLRCTQVLGGVGQMDHDPCFTADRHLDVLGELLW